MSNYKSSRKYLSKEECLGLINLKIICEDNKLYLVDLEETFSQRIYSKSFTDINNGLKKLKRDNKSHFDSIGSKCYNKAIYCLQLKECLWCHKAFKPKNNAEKYCSKSCGDYAKAEQDRDNKRKLRKNPNYFEKNLGTGYLGPHRDKDFENEYMIVKKELTIIKRKKH